MKTWRQSGEILMVQMQVNNEDIKMKKFEIIINGQMLKNKHLQVKLIFYDNSEIIDFQFFYFFHFFKLFFLSFLFFLF